MTTNDATDVRELLTALSDGRMSLNEVAQHFRERTWIRRQPQRYASDLEWMGAELDDAEPHLPGSFDDVSAAYHRDEITLEQYSVLREAVLDSYRTEDQGNTE